MDKKRRNYGEKVLTMTQFLNSFFNNNYGVEEGIDELSAYYDSLRFSHRELSEYLAELRVNLTILKREKTLEDVENELATCNKDFLATLEKVGTMAEKNRVTNILNNKINSLKDEAFKLVHYDELMDACCNFRRLPNDVVNEYDVLTGSAVLVADANNNTAYYINPERENKYDDTMTMYEREHATEEGLEEYNERHVEKVLRRRNYNDKYQRR